MKLTDLNNICMLMSEYYDDLVEHYEETVGDSIEGHEEATLPVTSESAKTLLVESLVSKFRFFYSKSNPHRLNLHTLYELVKDPVNIDWVEVYKVLMRNYGPKFTHLHDTPYLIFADLDSSHLNIDLLRRDATSLLYRLQRPVQKTIAIMDSLNNIGIIDAIEDTPSDLTDMRLKLNQARVVVNEIDDLVVRLLNTPI